MTDSVSRPMADSASRPGTQLATRVRGADFPLATEFRDRIPAARYYDPDFFALEAEHLWSRVWQMA